MAVLLELAKKYSAPFADTALKRLHGNVFGSGRATRSTDVAIINASKKNFSLKSNNCAHGGYSTGLFPEPKIMSKKSSVFGMESHGFATGVECTTRYESSDGSFFQVTANNPYIGSNSIKESFSKDLQLIPTKGQGDNNQVRWIIQSK